MLDYKEIITYIFVIGIAQAIFLFFILWNKKENRFATRFLAITMFVFAFDLLGGVFFLAGYIEYIPWFLGLNSAFPYLYGPLIYLYLIFLIHKQETFEFHDYLHLAPFVLIQVYGFFFFYFEGAEYQISLLDYTIEQPWHIKLIGMGIPVSGIIYLFFTVYETIKFNKKIKNSLSNIEGLDISWLLYLIFGTGIIWLVVLLSYTLNNVYGDAMQANLLIYVTLSIFLYTFAIKSYRQPQLVSNDIEVSKPYYKSGLSETKANEFLKRIIDHMKRDKPFLDPKLNLSQLSENLNISSHNLSETINTKLNQNFYDFINSYRVEEVKRLIEDDRNSVYSILAHGFEAGFTSKSSYYSAFKKFTGITPAKFRSNSLSFK